MKKQVNMQIHKSRKYQLNDERNMINDLNKVALQGKMTQKCSINSRRNKTQVEKNNLKRTDEVNRMKVRGRKGCARHTTERSDER